MLRGAIAFAAPFGLAFVLFAAGTADAYHTRFVK